MIVRHIPMRSIRKSSFEELIRYITSTEGKQERVGEIRITNCLSTDLNWAVHEVLTTQNQNQRAVGDKNYHLLISFPKGEAPSSSILKDIEDKIAASIGYAHHQRISAIHYDTDNVHIHVAINKIHPTRYTMHEPFRAYKALGEIAEKLEIMHNLQQTNHHPKKVLSENLASDMEYHAGIESLLGWIKRQCLEPMKNAQNWPQLHQVMQENGLSLKERGNGLVIIDESGFAVKASSVARELSKNKLEERLGIFEPKINQRQSSDKLKTKKPGIGKVGTNPPHWRQNTLSSIRQLQLMVIENGPRYSLQPIVTAHNASTDILYARYISEQNNAKYYRSSAFSNARRQKDRLIASTKQSCRLKRAAIKLLKNDKVNKKVLHTLTSKALKAEIEQIIKNYHKERQAIYEKYKQVAWADWLKLKALAGETDALSALRLRTKREPLNGNIFTGDKKRHCSVLSDLPIDNITKTGTVIYKNGQSAIRDDGNALKIANDFSEKDLKIALRMAIQRYGTCLKVRGSDEFKEQIAQITAGLKLNIQFDDAALEKRRQDLLNLSTIKENKHDLSRKYNLERRRTNRTGNEDLGRVHTNSIIPMERQQGRNKGKRNKPNIGRIGQQPPPISKNGLRNLSELSVVQLAGRSEMLLSSDVSRDLEHQGTQSNNILRRHVSGAGANVKSSEAADKYITERELKRQKIADIPIHRKYKKGDEGVVEFAGLRYVDGEVLALLRHKKEIIVLSVDDSIASRMKKLSIGKEITLTSTGIGITKVCKR